MQSDWQAEVCRLNTKEKILSIDHHLGVLRFIYSLDTIYTMLHLTEAT